MKTSQKGIDLIKQFEGCRLTAYQDIVGIWTIGYGNTYYLDGTKVKQGDKITQDQAEQGLLNLLKKYEDPINSYCESQGITLNQNQFDALVSLRWNIGNVKAQLDLFHANKLTKDIWCQYSYAGGQFVQGLYNRREKEWNLFIAPVVEEQEQNNQDKIIKIQSLLEEIINILKTCK